ncbi:MAG: POTRA domain-containing protein [Bacteroidota bacterium]
MIQIASFLAMTNIQIPYFYNDLSTEPEMRLLRVIVFLFILGTSLPCIAQNVRVPRDTTQPGFSDIIAQKNTPVVIGNVFLSGNKRTKSFIVLREVPFAQGDHFLEGELDEKLVLARQQVMNTSLFVDVTVYISARVGNVVDINIDLKERWYFFPLPYFRLIDRNFNQWWVEQHRSLDRVNYGIKFTQNNVSGRNDNLDVWLINGYTQQITLRYDLPFFDKTLKKGFNIGLIYATQKEINYATGDNKQLFYKQESAPARKALHFDFTYSYRPDVKQRHYFRVSYNDERIADTVAKINPLYFPEQRTRLQFVDFGYQYKYYNVDLISYPTSGFLGEANLYRRGLDNVSGLWQVSGRAVYAKPITRTSFLHLEGFAIAKAPFKNYFVNERLFGYGFYQMRGLEYNVVDGMLGAALKTTVHKQLLAFVLHNPFKSKTHDKIPFRIFLKAYGDLGYAYSPSPNITNTLNNKLLRTWGFGMDIVSVYDFVFKIEYSFNQLGKDGLYLQTRNDF